LAPSISFASGQDTGIYFDGFGIDLTVDGDTKVQFTPGGYVFFNQQIYLNCGSGVGSCGSSQEIRYDTTDFRFEFADNIATAASISVGSLAGPTPNYNHFGAAGAPASVGEITSASDVFVADDLEVASNLYTRQTIVLGDATPTAGQLFNSIGEAGGKDDAGVSGSDDLYVAGNLEVDGEVNVPTLHGPRPGFVMELRSDNNIRSMIDDNNNGTNELFEWHHNGSFLAADKLADLNESGNLRIRGTLSQNFVFDVAEAFLKGEPMEPGDVVRVDPKRTNAVLRTKGEFDPAVLGVVSEKPGVFLGGAVFGPEDLKPWGEDVMKRFEEREPALLEIARAKPAPEAGKASPTGDASLIEASLRDEALRRFQEEAFAPVALSGRVPVKVDTQFGAIRVGDLLAPSPVPGVAMKAVKAGSVIGTALEDFSGGRGKVLAFVHLGSYTPPVDGQQVQDLSSRTPDAKTGTETLEGNLQIVLDKGADDRARLSVFKDGQSTLGAEVFRVDEEGNVYAKGAFRPASLDLAEYHRVSEPVEVGDVLVVDREREETLRKGSAPADPAVVGIVSGEPGVLMGSGLSRIAASDPGLAARLDEVRSRGDRTDEARLWSELELKFRLTHAAVALSGTVPCKVDASYGAIRVGDLLAVSPTPGHAMRSPDTAPGTVLGKALESLEAGRGTINVLVMMR